MLVTGVGDQMCWRQVSDVDDKSCRQHQGLGTNIVYSKISTNMHLMSPRFSFCLQDYISVINITFWYITMLLTDWHVIIMQKNVTDTPFCYQRNDVINSTVESTIRVMDHPLSFLKIICLANTHLSHKGSFSLTQKIVCFQPSRSSALACIVCLDPKIVCFGSQDRLL